MSPSPHVTESSPTPVTTETVNIDTIDFQSMPHKLLGIPQDANIKFFDKEYVVYSLASEQSETMEVKLYLYHIASSEIQYITNIVFPNSYSNAALIYDNYLFVIGSLQNGPTGVHKIDMNTMKSTVILEVKENAGFTSIYQAGENIILYYICPSNDGNMAYKIFSIDYTTLKYTEITKVFSNGEGTCISCIYAEDDHIFSYEIIMENDHLQYKVVVYTLNGDIVAEYPLDLSGFIEVEGKKSSDSVIALCKKGNYIILNTINGRVYVLDIAEQTAHNIPKNLFEKIPSGYRLFNGSSMGRNIYIISNAHEPQIYLFDTSTGEFIGTSIVAPSSEQFRYISCYQNLFLVEVQYNGEATEFYLMTLL